MKIKKITQEFLDSKQTLKGISQPAVSIFGSARTKSNDHYYLLTVKIAKALGDAGYSIITGGGPGIMEAANKGAQLANTDSIGLVISLPFEAVNNEYIDDEFNMQYNYFFPRKCAFVANSGAFVVMPGGYGTMDELFEVLTLMQCGKTRKRPVILVGSGFWKPLLSFIKGLRGITISYGDEDLFNVVDTAEEVVEIVNKEKAKDVKLTKIK